MRYDKGWKPGVREQRVKKDLRFTIIPFDHGIHGEVLAEEQTLPDGQEGPGQLPPDLDGHWASKPSVSGQ